ncbi:hypothetical protein MLD38_010070 [Melastoma candidum]|uniref:Uncharacterized protein n=1 Tax=Melastoma candidum TaxID=119954 RepID=A0ACB9QYQ3_9MYRT|nr:hypothetical protein MLD38_010070 [Melastoma candidum]
MEGPSAAWPNWDGLLSPLDSDLRRYIIHYGEMAQATYDAFDEEKSLEISRELPLRQEGLLRPGWYLLLGILQIPGRRGSKESKLDRVRCSFDRRGKQSLGRRDIVVSWRGTLQNFEWVNDFEFDLVSASDILGEASNPMVHQGWLSIYTSNDPRSPFTNESARDQVLKEVKRLVDLYKNEETSITITGHSLGAAIATLNSVDIVANAIKQAKRPKTQAHPGNGVPLRKPKGRGPNLLPCLL